MVGSTDKSHVNLRGISDFKETYGMHKKGEKKFVTVKRCQYNNQYRVPNE